MHILLQVLKFKAIKASEIGVITPYDAQKKKIKNEIINHARVRYLLNLFLFFPEIANYFWINC